MVGRIAIFLHSLEVWTNIFEADAYQVHSLRRLEESLDPTIELNRLIRGGMMEEAFNKALTAGDLQIVFWLCNQVCCYYFIPALVT